MHVSDDLPPCPPRLEPLVLAGKVVQLEPLSVQHLDDLVQAALGSRDIWTYMPGAIATPGDVRQWLDEALRSQREGRALAFAVVLGPEKRAIGSTRLFDYRPLDRGVEIGYTWYARPYWATAVNPSSKLLLMQHAFERLRCVRVQLKTDARNLRSRGAIARLGAQEEGTLRRHMAVSDGSYIRDSTYFSVIVDEWPSVRSGLEARIAAAT